MTMNRTLKFFIATLMTTGAAAFAESPAAVEGHDAFIKSLREIKGNTSKPRTLSPVVSRFKGWFIDVTEKAKPGKLNDVDVVEGISLANNQQATSAWEFIQTEKGTSSGQQEVNTKAG